MLPIFYLMRVNTVLQGNVPGGITFTICVNMRVREFSEKGAFFRVRLRSQIRVSFLADLGNKGTFFRTLLMYGVILVVFFHGAFSLQWPFKIIHHCHSVIRALFIAYPGDTSHTNIGLSGSLLS